MERRDQHPADRVPVTDHDPTSRHRRCRRRQGERAHLVSGDHRIDRHVAARDELLDLRARLRERLLALLELAARDEAVGVEALQRLVLLGLLLEAPLVRSGQLPQARLVLLRGLDVVLLEALRVARDLGLDRKSIVDVVTARAVSALKTLVPMTVPLLQGSGELLAIKGRSAAEDKAAEEWRGWEVSRRIEREQELRGNL